MDEMYVFITFIVGVLLFIGSVYLYFLPTVIASKRKHPNTWTIMLINLLFGWTFLGWIGCLVWACLDVNKNTTGRVFRNVGGNKYEDLARLQRLRETGAITEIEFEIEKQKLLK